MKFNGNRYPLDPVLGLFFKTRSCFKNGSIFFFLRNKPWCHSRNLNNRTNNMYQRARRIVYQNKNSSFEE